MRPTATGLGVALLVCVSTRAQDPLGSTFWFAYGQDGVVWDFASNAVAVRVAL